MRNPWRMQDGPDNKINRNNFPMSFQYNGTFKYGKIYPIGLWRTIPGASYQIDSTLALNFMPTTFPIQTRQRAYVHFFYGRDRNFWKDYKDFVNGMSPDLVKPYIDEGITKARTGNLLDYLGVPTTIVGKYGQYEDKGTFGFLAGNSYEFVTNFGDSSIYVSDGNVKDVTQFLSSLEGSTLTISSRDSIPSGLNKALLIDMSNLLGSEFTSIRVSSSLTSFLGTFSETTTNNVPYATPVLREQNTIANTSCFCLLDDSNRVVKVFPLTSSDETFATYDYSFDGDVSRLNLRLVFLVHTSVDGWYYNTYSENSGLSMSKQLVYNKDFIFQIYNENYGSLVRDIDDTTSPYWRSNDTRGKSTIKLSAIPPRMYETIYNLYYRNPQNNPYILNGKPEYNIFIPTKDGGADSNLYQLRYRNWEDDFLTTAVQTPQQGIAPLVGLTDRGATVTLTNEDGTVTRYKTNLDENGNVTGIETTDSSEPLLTQALIDAVSYGISIEDLRNVNAMQKWLELNLRKGYQYKDIIEARWGISISYNELDLPEFIGGFTQEVGLQAVTQTTSHGEGIEGALGWQAGRMYAAGSGRSITHYCEEEGYIMALLTVVPVPNYSQLLPKHWFTRDLLDSYQPEFNHIGFQPITYKEVCPIQAFQESTENVDVLEQTFGYQRPWYEYFNQVDEVHGQFRTTFKDFLINRTFDVKPELSESFLLVDPNQVNDVFAVTTDDDKIIGAIEHRITAKLPISLYAQARLE